MGLPANLSKMRIWTNVKGRINAFERDVYAYHVSGIYAHNYETWKRQAARQAARQAGRQAGTTITKFSTVLHENYPDSRRRGSQVMQEEVGASGEPGAHFSAEFPVLEHTTSTNCHIFILK